MPILLLLLILSGGVAYGAETRLPITAKIISYEDAYILCTESIETPKWCPDKWLETEEEYDEESIEFEEIYE